MNLVEIILVSPCVSMAGGMADLLKYHGVGHLVAVGRRPGRRGRLRRRTAIQVLVSIGADGPVTQGISGSGRALVVAA